MTLIVSCITSDFVVQASDRRVSIPELGTGDDQANKAIFFCGQSTWAYTGLAQIGAQRTDEWLVEHLYRHDKLPVALRQMASRLDRAVPPLPLNRAAKRLAVVGVGFATFPDVGHKPYVAWVSDSLDPPCAWRPVPRPSFVPYVNPLNAKTTLFQLCWYGQRVSGEDQAGLRAAVRAAVRQAVGPIAIARLLTNHIQGIASGNHLVGGNVMCTLLTRDGVTPGDPSMRSALIPLDPDAPNADRFRPFQDFDGKPCFLYIPATSGALVHYGPMSVCKGIAVGGVMFRPTEAMNDLPSGNPFPPYQLSLIR